MSDVIANAKQLLEGVTPGDWVAIPHDDWDNAKVIAPDDEPGVCEIATMFQEEHDLADAKLMAASKTHAQALAEETYEYAVEEKWLTNDGPVWRAAGNRWHLSMSAAQSDAVQYCQTRIVRRRVSPPEVIE